MLGEKALELVKELHRSRSGTLPPFNVSYSSILWSFLMFFFDYTPVWLRVCFDIQSWHSLIEIFSQQRKWRNSRWFAQIRFVQLCESSVELPEWSLRLSSSGFCWTKGRWGHSASTLLSLDWAKSGTTGWASSWISPLSPRPCWLHRLPVRLHKVNHKVNQTLIQSTKLGWN